jgi:cysteine desulfurase
MAIYLDNNATTPFGPGVADAMREFMDESFGNPSSSHQLSDRPRVVIESARAEVAKLIGAGSSDEIVFTSGGTESNNWAIRAAVESGRCHLITSTVEHESVRRVMDDAEADGCDVSRIDVDRDGALDIDQLLSELRPDTRLVSIMWVNNETGVVFPVEDIAALVKERSDALVHVDAVNAIGKVPTDLSSSAIDLLSMSAHKFYGPKGIGALYIRDGVDLKPLFLGGSQQSSRRAGTEPVHQIAGMAAAAGYVSDLGQMESIRSLRDMLERRLMDAIPDMEIHGAESPRLPNTANISFIRTNGEMIAARLDQEGICVSTGSACNSASHEASPVLTAMDVPYSTAMGSIRFSLGRTTTSQEIDEVVRVLPGIVSDVRRLAGV